MKFKYGNLKFLIKFFFIKFIKVTIDGESAGSMSVMALYTTRQSKGLFHKAIAQSGTVAGPLFQNYLHPKCVVE